MTPLLIVVVLLSAVGLLVLIVGFAVAYGRGQRAVRSAWKGTQAAARATLHAAPDAAWRDLGGITMASLAADPALYARVREVLRAAEPDDGGARPESPVETESSVVETESPEGADVDSGRDLAPGPDAAPVAEPDRDPGRALTSVDAAEWAEGVIDRDSAAFRSLHDQLWDLDDRIALVLGAEQKPFTFDEDRLRVRLRRAARDGTIAASDADATVEAVDILERLKAGGTVDVRSMLDALVAVRRAWLALGRFGSAHPPGDEEPVP